MYVSVVDGNGLSWSLKKTEDGLRVFADDQSFDAKEQWNRLVRTATSLFSLEMHAHATPVADSSTIQYTTENGEHRTLLSADTTWQMLNDTPTLGFKPPSHLSTPTASSSAAWVPIVQWNHSASIPLGWNEPYPRSTSPPACTPMETKEVEISVEAVEEKVAASIPVEVAEEKIAASIPVEVVDEVSASIPVEVVDEVASIPVEVVDEVASIPPPPMEEVHEHVIEEVVQDERLNYNIMALSKEEQQQLDKILAQREQFQIKPTKKVAPGKDWTPAFNVPRAEPPKITPEPVKTTVVPIPEEIITLRPVAPGKSWMRPTIRLDVVEKIEEPMPVKQAYVSKGWVRLTSAPACGDCDKKKKPKPMEGFRF